ncbi:hypothetical protein FRX31_013632, partial [Thalictrum thalictroides]
MRPRRPGRGSRNPSPPSRRRLSPRFTDDRRRHNDSYNSYRSQVDDRRQHGDSYNSYRSQVDDRRQHQERPRRSLSPSRAGKERSQRVVLSPRRRSLSPSRGGQVRPQRVLMSPRSRSSVERRDYSKVSDGGFGDRILNSKDQSPHYNGGFRPKRDSSPNDYHRKYSLSERTNRDSDFNTSTKYIGGFEPSVSRANREKDSYSIGSSSLNAR